MYIHIDAEKGLRCSEGLSFVDALRLIGTATLHLMNDVDDYAKENAKTDEEYNDAHGKVYDLYNHMAGNILDQFDCTRSPATDLTTQAIMEAENAILDRETAEVESEETSETTEEEDDSPA